MSSGTSIIPAGVLGRVVHVERKEVPALLWSFLAFFSVLCAYYILRPVRDGMGVAMGPDGLRNTFSIVFLVMLAAVPLFGWIVSTVPRHLIAVLVYGFFIANLAAFWLLFAQSTDPRLARVFFVWASVFNLFVVSMFWILMSDLWSSAEAKRLFGFISAGGTAGAISGPLVAGILSRHIETHNLLLVSAVMLSVALFSITRLRGRIRPEPGSERPPAGLGTILAGASSVLRSPYLIRIALIVLFANLVGTYFYLEQSRIVGEAIPDKKEQVTFFASRDLAVSLLTLTIEMFVTGRVMERLGLTPALVALPITAITGLLALTAAPELQVVAAVMVAERTVAFSLANPAIKVLWTAADRDEKYKAQNFIDTVVYRGGDAASGWVFNALAKGLGLSGAAIALAAIPIAVAWLMTSLGLARMHSARTAAADASPRA